MRVVHFAETLKGGPATYLNELLPFQVRAYDKVTVFVPASQASFITCPGVSVEAYPDARRSLLGVAQLARHWVRHARTNDYDVIHLHSTFAGLAGRLAPRSNGLRIVYCPHGWSFAMDTTPVKKQVYSLAERLLALRTDTIVNISRSEENLSVRAGIPKAKTRLVYNGIGNAEWAPLPAGSDGKRLLFVGRYDRQKGVDILIEAMKDLGPRGYGLTMIGGPVVGEPPIRAIPENVVDLGWRSENDVRQAMTEADAVVMPSRWEGFSLVALEAMRMGRPIVATSASSLPEAVIDGETGVLCPPGSAQEFARAVLRLADMDMRQLGINGRERYERLFTAERMFHQLETIYRGPRR
ncbi:glycosyltransferase [Pelagibacterium halotolerans]|uniref:glycosyltransferase n=1 Tax=Pelagibacterium halotolerans TaxID=531813 RepID=UPI00384FD4A0